MDERDPIIRASEIAQYAFCARAWWLGRVKGYRSANVTAMDQGTRRHHAHGRAVQGYHLLKQVAVALLLLSGAVLLAWVLLSLGS